MSGLRSLHKLSSSLRLAGFVDISEVRLPVYLVENLLPLGLCICIILACIVKQIIVYISNVGGPAWPCSMKDVM